METIFKKWDRVYHFVYGWGNIVYIADDGFPLEVEFDNRKSPYKDMFKDGYLLSFSEYTLEGFSQERPEELPKRGQVVWVRDEFPSDWIVGHFFKKENGKYYISYNPSLKGWNTNGTEIKTINPYENEQ
jgi:hypothetical protein